MIEVRIEADLVDDLLTPRGARMGRCIEGLPEGARLFWVRWDDHRRQVVMQFEHESAIGKRVIILPKLAGHKCATCAPCHTALDRWPAPPEATP